jgi:hypothetical protein
MRNKLAAVSICAASLAAACVDRPAPVPTAPTATTPRTDVSAAATFNTLACDFTALKADARAYAASNKDPIFTIISDLQSLVKNGPNAAGTDKVYDGLSRLALMRGTALQQVGVAGSVFDDFTRRFLGCAESYIVAGAPPQDFSTALLAGWMYEVRGKPNVDPEIGAYERGATGSYWAAEALPTTTWAATIVVTAPAGTTATDRAFVFGYRTSFLTNDPKVGSAFEHFTIPAIAGGALTLNPALNIGLCNVTTNVTNLRVQHVNTVLPKSALTCSTPPQFANAATSSSIMLASGAALARRAFGFFAPENAYAAFLAGSVGGAPSELSPSAVIDMQQVTAAFLNPIADGTNSTALKDTTGGPVRVTVKTLGGTPLPNATVVLSVSGNSSVIAYFSDNGGASVVTVSRTTNAAGVASFDGVSLTKAGGYQLTATPTFDGVAGPPALSNSFNIQNK